MEKKLISVVANIYLYKISRLFKNFDNECIKFMVSVLTGLKIPFDEALRKPEGCKQSTVEACEEEKDSSIKQVPKSGSLDEEDKIADSKQCSSINTQCSSFVKLPMLIASTEITELVAKEIVFSEPILSILKVKNEVFITESEIVTYFDENSFKGVLVYEGHLKTDLEYLEDATTNRDAINSYDIEGKAKHYITFTPFYGTKEIILKGETIKEGDIVLKNLPIDMKKCTFSVNTSLKEETSRNKFVKEYKSCNVIVVLVCDIDIFKEELVGI